MGPISLDTFVPSPASGAWIATAVGEKLEMLRNVSCRFLLNH